MRVHGPARDQFGRGPCRQLHLVFGAEQDDVRQCGFHRVADAPRAIAAGCFIRGRKIGRRGIRRHVRVRAATPHIAQVRGIDQEASDERSAQRLVRRDQRVQAFVDLPVLAFAPLLQRLITSKRSPTPISVIAASPTSVDSSACQEEKSRLRMRDSGNEK